MSPDLSEYFRFNRLVMNLIGGWCFPDDRTIIAKNVYGFVAGVVVVLGTLDEILNMVMNKDNIFIIAESIGNFMMCVTGIVKNHRLMLCKSVQREMLRTMDNLLTELPVDLRVTSDILLGRAQKIAHALTKVIFLNYLMIWLTYMIIPWIHIVASDEKVISLPVYIPYSIQEWGTFMMVYGGTFLLGMWMVIIVSAVESFLASSVLFLCTRIDMLHLALNKATEEAIENNNTLFRRCVQYQLKIYRCYELLEEYYRPVHLIQFIASTMSICTLLFLSLQWRSTPAEKHFTYMSFFLSVLLQLCIPCYFGQMLETKMGGLSATAYGAKWCGAPAWFQKDLGLFMLRSSRPVQLTAYKMMPVNLESYFTVMKTTASYYTMLLNFKK